MISGPCSALLEPIRTQSCRIRFTRLAALAVSDVASLGVSDLGGALRYWNIARQRHYRSSARYCSALRVSADRAARHRPQTGGKRGLCQGTRPKSGERRTLCGDPLRGSRAFLASETVMPVAGLCPACSCGPMAAGLDGLSASRGSHLDFALDAHALASGLPRSSVRLTVRHLLRPAFRSVTCREFSIRRPAAAALDRRRLA